METVYTSLQGINAYPIPNRTLVTIMVKRGLQPETETTMDVLTCAEFNLARADVLFWLSCAPNVTQGGQSYSFTDEQRKRMRNEALALYDEFEEDETAVKPIYGYKGTNL